MDLFQKPYDAIKRWTAPAWLKNLLKTSNDIMMAILEEVSQAYIDYLKAKIIEASEHSDWSAGQKFEYVFKEAKSGFVSFGITLKDRQINALIQFLVNKMKEGGEIV